MEERVSYQVRCVAKTGPRRGEWVVILSDSSERDAWDYCVRNKNKLGMLEMWRVNGVWDARYPKDIAAESLHSIHYGSPAKTQEITMVG